jgi:hypothetical protein
MTLSSSIASSKSTFLSLNVFAPLLCLMLILSLWNAYDSQVDLKAAQTELVRFRDLSDTLRNYDRILTLSARMATSSGEQSWILRYNERVHKIDDALENIDTLADRYSTTLSATKLDSANTRLVKMEEEAFRLATNGRLKEARKLLFGYRIRT